MNIERMVMRFLASSTLYRRLEKEGYVKDAAIAEYELLIEKEEINRVAGKALSWYDMIRFLRKKDKYLP